MKRILYLTATLAAGAFLLSGTMASAKNKAASKSTAPPKATAGRSSGQKGHHGQAPGMAVDHAGGNTPKAKPKSGENPLFESKDRAVKNKPAAKTSAGSATTEYKDPEDMTTRYRPGNNKTTKAASKKTKHGSATASHQ